MTIRLLHERYYDIALSGGHASLPLDSPSSMPPNTEFTDFGFIVPGAPEFGFFPGWKVRTSTGNEFNTLRAMFTGLIRLKRIVGESLYFQLLLIPNDPVLVRVLKHMRPEWISPPGVVIYENVDPAGVRRALLDLLNSQPELVISNMRYLNAEFEDRFYASWDHVVEDFLAIEGRTPEELSEFPITVKAGLIIGTAATSAGDPSRIEFRLFMKNSEGDLFINPSYYVRGWRDLFEGVQAHLLLRDMETVRWGMVTNMRFRYVRRTGGVSGAGEEFTDPTRPSTTITEAIDRAQHNDAVVILDEAQYSEPELVITKPLTLSSINEADVRNDTVAPSIFPQLDGNGNHRVIRIETGEFSEGLVCIRNVTIQNGQVTDTEGDGYLGGGGILVNGRDSTIIENCFIRDNQSLVGGTRDIDLISELNRISNPLKRTAIRTILNNAAPGRNLSAVENGGLLAHGYGGGISLISSSAYILFNHISQNRSGGRGAGIGCAAYSWPVIESNTIRDNAASSAGRRDGGGIGCTIAVPNKMGMDLRPRTLVEQLIDFINDVDYLELLGMTDLYSVMKEFIRRQRSQWFYENKLREAKAKNLYIRGNIIHNNSAVDDGGGIYLSILAQAYLSSNEILENSTQRGGGGAIRATMSANLVLEANQIIRNQSNTARIGVDEAGSGGGGLACRNIELEIKRTTIQGNTANGWAGGGIFFTASDEGGFVLPQFRIFHVILVDVFEFHDCIIRIHETSQITSNSATQVSGQGNHGKGGGVYFLRYQDSDIPTLDLIIENYRRVVSGNNGSFANADNFTLNDEPGGIPEINDSSVGSHITDGELRYSAR